jgi:CheY-like chemotaxis protein
LTTPTSILSSNEMIRQRILYVEDNPELLALVRLLLERDLPVSVDICATAYGAEGMLNQHCYDLIICDVNLPGELGTTVVEKVLDRDPEQPVMLITEYRSPEIKAEVDRLSAKFEKQVPLAPKFSEISCPLAFVEKVRHALESNFCEERARANAEHCHPAGRISLTSDCVKAARRALAA